VSGICVKNLKEGFSPVAACEELITHIAAELLKKLDVLVERLAAASPVCKVDDPDAADAKAA
jgi:hypothetical protein